MLTLRAGFGEMSARQGWAKRSTIKSNSTFQTDRGSFANYAYPKTAFYITIKLLD
jgi:hypothetical protein